MADKKEPTVPRLIKDMKPMDTYTTTDPSGRDRLIQFGRGIGTAEYFRDLPNQWEYIQNKDDPEMPEHARGGLVTKHGSSTRVTCKHKG